MLEAASNPFFATLHQLVESSEVVVDRPRGMAHPRIPEAVYPVDYGYLSGTTSADGEGIDVFLGTGDPSEVTAVILTADAIKRDAEIKVLLGCAVEETAAVQRFIAEVRAAGHEELSGLSPPRFKRDVAEEGGLAAPKYVSLSTGNPAQLEADAFAVAFLECLPAFREVVAVNGELEVVPFVDGVGVGSHIVWARAQAGDPVLNRVNRNPGCVPTSVRHRRHRAWPRCEGHSCAAAVAGDIGSQRPVLVFDVLGTLVDQSGSLEAHLMTRAGLDRAAAAAMVSTWLGYVAAEERAIVTGRRAFAPSHVLDREAVARLVEDGSLPEASAEMLSCASEHMTPWPDTTTGLEALSRFTTVLGLSNASRRVLAALSANAGMRWHQILSAEDAATYKPDPALYAVAVSSSPSSSVPPIMVAAHAWDLRAAAAAGMRTAYMPRLNGDAPRPDDDFDIMATSFQDFAAQLGRGSP